jgi:hypothetical protein
VRLSLCSQFPSQLSPAGEGILIIRSDADGSERPTISTSRRFEVPPMCTLQLEGVILMLTGGASQEPLVKGRVRYLRGAEQQGRIQNLGEVVYQLPTPLGSWVPGITLPCSETPLSCTLGARPSTLAAVFDGQRDNFTVPSLPRPCAAGFYGNASEAAHQTDATCEAECPPAHYCPTGSVKPLPCPEGSFNPSPGAASPSACIACPRGSYCPKGAAQHTECSSNTFSADYSQTACTPCPEGQSCPTGAIAPLPTL